MALVLVSQPDHLRCLMAANLGGELPEEEETAKWDALVVSRRLPTRCAACPVPAARWLLHCLPGADGSAPCKSICRAGAGVGCAAAAQWPTLFPMLAPVVCTSPMLPPLAALPCCAGGAGP